ncbi:MULTISPECIES: flagellar export chaperone FliS [Enterobacter]|jgi:flagellar protein FliS|uniref:Flagellar secretion chaperone FliS n=2 Tax=Enterobacter TaxID=547 RepID=A0A3R9NQW2_9ENTR|nr:MULTISPECIES: flagellar export chaperone FliS [Enterobacter]MCS5451974.1 flagellar export chaperone FliS [Enterobacter huaxiensis]MCV2534250.1 flagellar export chaperone FliS [Enterobacter wuhouensis]MEB7544964.1 flagellar export chaperone FliS [Enterobacter huaxiensis]MEB7583215.1 flagellar export chaperone FliS [Enterobacter huaxiensis]MEB7665386.1 flagellar export chaperone FliS [Enterobacter huaxiensis]
MYGNEQQGYGHYQQSDLAIQAAAANPHQLVLMLFNGLMDELVRAKSHIAARRYDRKVQSVNKCIDILNALTSSLDFEKGGELALSLANLYDYCVYRLYDASHKLSVASVEEVEVILRNLQDGWEKMGQQNG